MGLIGWVRLIQAAFEFPAELGKLIKLMRRTPVEKRAKLVEGMQREHDSIAKTGRPTWES